jgi:SAM-dependent methyltransferase
MADTRDHWEHVWTDKPADEVSWYQPDPQPCLDWVRRVSAPSDRIAIVGAGASTLISSLLADGYGGLIAVDISAAALVQLRAQLGARADQIRTIVADVRDVVIDPPVDVWHDRATFHFLTHEDDQNRYIDRAAAAVRPGGSLILAVFAPDGPEQCSGLPVRRWSVADLAARLAPWFELTDHTARIHTTPWGAPQSFTHVLMTRSDHGRGG